MKIAVKSELIAFVRYRERNQRLVLTFNDGSTTEYGLVPRTVVDRLISASSPGRYYIEEIRGRFPRLSKISARRLLPTRWLFSHA